MRKYFRLKEFRDENDLKQSDVAKLFECHQTNISRIENQFCDLEDYQYKILYELYGHDSVDKYKVVSEETTYNINKTENTISGNNNSGNNVGGSVSNEGLLEIVKNQNKQIDSLLEQNKALTEAINKLTSIVGGMKIGQSL